MQSPKDAISNIDAHNIGQHQGGVDEQLTLLRSAANKLGLYDAADWLRDVRENLERKPAPRPQRNPDAPIYFKDANNDEIIVCRSYGKTPNGNPMGGRWGVFRISSGEMLDFDQYINDIKSRWGLDN